MLKFLISFFSIELVALGNIGNIVLHFFSQTTNGAGREELETIKKFSNTKDHIIMIDDTLDIDSIKFIFMEM